MDAWGGGSWGHVFVEGKEQQVFYRWVDSLFVSQIDSTSYDHVLQFDHGGLLGHVFFLLLMDTNRLRQFLF